MSQEQDRLKSIATLSGTQPPLSETQEYDFINANLYDLAELTLETFSDDGPINNMFIVVVDARSLKDRTCILVEIPEQVQLDGTKHKNVVKRDRKFHRRDEYVPDPKGWLDGQGEETGVEELKVVRVKFEEANIVDTLEVGQIDIGLLAMSTYQTDGVHVEGAQYP